MHWGSKDGVVVQGVCHRDLKLENILLDDSSPPHIKICDFGYSKVGDWSDSTAGH